jgi:hypothetical protein
MLQNRVLRRILRPNKQVGQSQLLRDLKRELLPASWRVSYLAGVTIVAWMSSCTDAGLTDGRSTAEGFCKISQKGLKLLKG